MKINNEIFTEKLDTSSIDIISDKIKNFLTELGTEKREIMRSSLSAEEIMLKSMDHSDDNTTVTLETGKKLFKPFFSLSISGKSKNVFEDGDGTTLGDSMLRNLGLSPEYEYKNESNNYFFKVKKKSINPFLKLILAIVFALAVGFCGLLLPENVINSVMTFFLTPLHDTFLNVLGCIAGPMIFLSVAWGIYGIGDASTLKKMGKKMLGSYIGIIYCIVIILFIAFYPLFSFNFAQYSGNESGFSSILNMILGIFPENIFSPFVNGNTMQIIFLAIVIGIAMLFLGQKTTSVAKAVEQINYIVQFLIEFISRLVPYFIFIVIVGMVWSNTLSVFISVIKFFLIYLIGAIALCLIIACYAAIKVKVSPVKLIKKGLPTLLIAVTTASSAAAFGTNMNACQNGYGIDDKISSFGIPLGMVTFKPTAAVSYLVISMFFAEFYKVNVSLPWFIIMLFSVGILAIATPPIPGGALTAYTVLFSQLNIPAEALAIALACDAIIDFIATGGDQFTLPLALIVQANRFGLIKRDILEK